MKMFADPATKIVTVPVTTTTATVALAIATPRGTTDDTPAGMRLIAESRLAGIFSRKFKFYLECFVIVNFKFICFL